MTTTYRNGFYELAAPRKTVEFFTTSARPLQWAGHTIYQRIKGSCWDVVKDGVCVGMYAGLSGAKDCAEKRQRHGLGADQPGSWMIPTEACADILSLANRLTARAEAR